MALRTTVESKRLSNYNPVWYENEMTEKLSERFNGEEGLILIQGFS
jgi:hypothetical protein